MSNLVGMQDQFTGSPNYNMELLLEVLSGSEIVPQPNKYYVFVYKAKTPNIQYDQHPLILCGSVHKWGFTGYNFHWGEIRQYSFGEVLSNVYELSEEDFEIVQNINIAKFRTS
jgi:hypothetical protein